MSELKNGDIVKLKSGGPDMTIVEIGAFGYDPETRAKCQWFVDDEIKECLFSLDSLKDVKSRN